MMAVVVGCLSSGCSFGPEANLFGGGRVTTASADQMFDSGFEAFDDEKLFYLLARDSRVDYQAANDAQKIRILDKAFMEADGEFCPSTPNQPCNLPIRCNQILDRLIAASNQRCNLYMSSSFPYPSIQDWICNCFGLRAAAFGARNLVAAPLSLEDYVSHPFCGNKFTFTQPNGDKIEVRGWGDQNSARFETLDGYAIVLNPSSGYFEIATKAADDTPLQASGHHVGATPPQSIARGLKPGGTARKTSFTNNALGGKTRWQQRYEEQRAAIDASINGAGPHFAPPLRRTVGTFVGLCLPIRFPDVPTAITSEQISDFCNKPGYNGFGNNGSVRDYYLANSLGRCDYSTIVAPLYTAKKPRAYYADDNLPAGPRAQELIQEALDFHKSNKFDFTRLTADTSNFVYALNVFYAGEVVNNWARGLWPHSHFLSNPVMLAAGKLAHDYQITALGDELTLGTYCHENGHMLCDFPDLYDYDYDSAGIGDYCLMCGGNNADERNPVQIGAYLKFKAGWAGSVINLEHGFDASASADGNQFFVIRKNQREYYIIENRNKVGRDAALPDSGLAVWHCDESGNNSKQQGSATSHYECALIQADGRKDLEHNVNQGDPGDLFKTGNTFTGKWWNNQSIGVAIGSIGAPGASVAFKVS
ncbi:MAG TPA: M6 family metalloprotease domain-containing protein [Accumulibacter sp.]|uniref:M6 family metalloprotease domain-containing protein n=1 Tax=Accumulibacter sp. TaxID=2053492 RepID=UPI0025E09F95|nr:M6 family metalloprotease domain-containing protein [Accumulibacter sp.]MCM8662627.1 M6 family metalloprotease domain-containing protein [Accumulibacter sp.]HNC52637.1 M6 family metalloprotease domain-containing protein [Accumulibacter sp.]HNG04435.1 M6 family metalloprotease domain-containing protein [Nitrospira sp.]